MIYGFTMLPIATLMLAELAYQNTVHSHSIHAPIVVSWIVSVSFAFVIFGYTVLSNQAYFKLHMAYEQGYAYSIRLIAQIELLDGFNMDCTTYFIGVPSTQVDAVPESQRINRLTGIIGDIPATYTYPIFLNQYLASQMTIVSITSKSTEFIDIIQQFDVDKMPIYPNSGSVQKIGENIVVKFSEIYKGN